MRKVKTKRYTLYRGDNRLALAQIKDASIDVLISDPPYGMSQEQPDARKMLKAWVNGRDYKPKAKKGFFGAEWDAFVPQVSFWKEANRVLKPGGWCLAFFSARTYDIGTMAIRLAGFQVHDCIQWIYGTSSPRNHRMDRAVDRKKGVDIKKHYTRMGGNHPQTDEAKRWTGWGTNLRPCVELIALCRKPPEGSIVENVLKYNIGALNIEAARVPLASTYSYDSKQSKKRVIPLKTLEGKQLTDDNIPYLNENGRFPSHLILDPDSGKVLDSTTANEVSRFFYQPKVTQAERDWGTDGLAYKVTSAVESTSPLMLRKGWEGQQKNHFLSRNNHPTVKPVALMRYLVRLVAPYGAKVLDPFMGSGSTGIATLLEGCRFVGMEMDKSYFKIARTRIAFTENIINNHPSEKMVGLFG
jgi:DNA modification methylase